MNIVVFDTETTGFLQPENSDLTMQPKIIEFYGVKLNEEFEILDELNILINPGEPISAEITRITGITDSMVKDKFSFEDSFRDIDMLFEDADLSVAHNHGFDSGMLDVEYRRLGFIRPCATNELCTVEATMGMTGHRLSLTRLHWMLLKQEFKAHRAQDDVFALVRCLHNLTESGVIKFDDYRD